MIAALVFAMKSKSEAAIRTEQPANLKLTHSQLPRYADWPVLQGAIRGASSLKLGRLREAICHRWGPAGRCATTGSLLLERKSLLNLELRHALIRAFSLRCANDKLDVHAGRCIGPAKCADGRRRSQRRYSACQRDMLIGDRQALSGVPAAPAGTGQISLCPGVQVMMSVVLRGGLTSADESAG